MSIVLASSSPRRKQLLEAVGITDLIIHAAAAPEADCPGMTAEQTVRALSLAKAREVSARRPADDTVIAADTVVELDGVIFGKPVDKADAARMLRRLSGRRHRVFTGVTVISGASAVTEAEETFVYFRPLSGTEIDSYIACGEPMDKAGSYGIQGKGALFVERIEGDYFNVMGLPLCRLGRILEKLGVRLI